MADAYTQVSSLSSDTAAYEALSYFPLRAQLYFDSVASVKPTSQTHRGSSVTFFMYDDLAAVTSAMSETADPDSVAISDSTVVVTPAEYGQVVKTTAKLRVTSLLDVSSDVANIIGYNAGISIDGLARTALQAGSNVRYSTGTGTLPTARNTVTPTNTITASMFRQIKADLDDANVLPASGTLNWCYISPKVLYDLKAETGAGAWRTPHEYAAPEAIWTGEVGHFEGFRVVSTPRAPLFADSGSSTTLTDVYGTLFCGSQALALAHYQGEGYGRYPTIVKGPVVDALQRIQPIGWKVGIAYARFREAALRRVESASSIGANS